MEKLKRPKIRLGNMNSKLIVFVLVLFTIKTYSNNSIKIFYINRAMILSKSWISDMGDGINMPENYTIDGLLYRAKKAGYTHIITNFYANQMQAYGNYTNLYIKECFQIAEQYGLELIPGLTFSSFHCNEFWASVENSDQIKYPGTIPFNEIKSYYQGKPTSACSTPFEDDKGFITGTTPKFFKVINDAFIDAKNEAIIKKTPFVYNAKINFIFLGMDESYNIPVTYNPDGTPILDETGSPLIKEYTLLAGMNPSGADRNYINNISANKSTALAFRELYARNFFALLTQVQKSFGSDVKAMIFADMFDPAFTGKFVFKTYKPNLTVVLSPDTGNNQDVLDLPSLSPEQKNAVKNNVILLPWSYKTVDNGFVYNADYTFDYFKRKGFKVIPTSAFVREDKDKIALQVSYEMIDKYSILAKKYDNFIGSFTSFFPFTTSPAYYEWCNAWIGTTNDYYYSQKIDYNALEYVARAYNFMPFPYFSVNIPPNPAQGIAFLKMSQYEITKNEYYNTMGRLPQECVDENNTLPVTNVSYYDAIIYCNNRSTKEGLQKVYSYDNPHYNITGTCDYLSNLKIDKLKNGYRLPTVEEWKHAYLAGVDPNKNNNYYWPVDLTDNNGENYAWSSSNSSGKIHPVGMKLPNSWGLYDMAGNVEEWVEGGKSVGGDYLSYGDRLSYNCVPLTSKYLNANWLGFRVVRHLDITPVTNLLLSY